MAFLKINGKDYSSYVNSLDVTKNHNFNSQTNAAGDTVVDYINSKRVIEVGIIPLDAETMAALQKDIDSLGATLSFLNPKTGVLEENVACIIPSNGVGYYTIQKNKTLFNAFKIQFTEL